MEASNSYLVEQVGIVLVVTPRQNLGAFIRDEVHSDIFNVLSRIDDIEFR